MTRFIARPVVLAGIIVLGSPVLANAAHKTYQTANVTTFAGALVEGAGTLYRTEDEVWGTISMASLDKKAAYTVWAVVFNDPGECINGCGEDEINRAFMSADPSDPSVFYAAGFVTGSDGAATMSFHLEAGDLPNGIDVLPIGDGGGINADNGNGAEIHFVIRTHGKTIPGMVDEQIGSFNGACDLNFCDDQFAVAFPGL